MYDVVIVGAGASGLMLASILASKNIKILLIDKNDKLGKKLLITGNGKCNLGNKNIDDSKYNCNIVTTYKKYFDDLKKSKISLNVNYELKSYVEYLKRIGIFLKEDNDLLYPNNEQALSVCKSFEKYLNNYSIDIKYNCDVKKVVNKNDYYLINGFIKTKKIVIATGGLSYPKTGSTGYGYKILKSFGHKITKLYPSLVKLKTDYKYINDIKGVRLNTTCKLYINGDYIQSDKGQVQFTEDSISGICIFNLSRNIKRFLEKNNNINIVLSLIDGLNKGELLNKMDEFNNYYLIDFLSMIMNNKLAYAFCKENNCINVKIVNIKNKKVLIDKLDNYKFNIIDTAGFDFAQVTTGGACLNEFTYNLESLKSKGLYAVGEVLDVDGICGGYNLIWAFISSLIVSDDIISCL